MDFLNAISSFFISHWQAVLVSGVLVVVFLSMVREWLPPDVTAMAAFAFLLFTPILDAQAAKGIFSNPAPLIVGCMFILSAGLERTGVIEVLGRWFEKLAGKSEWRIFLVLALVVAPMSALMNNTPVVVVFMPIVLGLCRRQELQASRFLIPLSYIAITGGTCTIIGTSTNILVSGIAQEQGMKPFGIFEITPLGLIFVAVTVFYLMTVGRKLLPSRLTLATLFKPEEGREFLTQVLVDKDSPLLGKVYRETPLGKMHDVRILEVLRHGKKVPLPVKEITFQTGDQMLLKCRASGAQALSEAEGINVLPDAQLGLQQVWTESTVLMEGIIGPESSMVGKTLGELDFSHRYGVQILALHRQGVNLRERLEKTPLAFGDTLLVTGPVEKMNELFSLKDFINLSKPPLRDFRPTKAPIVIIALLGFILLGSTGAFDLMQLGIGAVALLLVSRCLDPQDAYNAVEWRVLFMIYGMLGLGMSMEQSGLIDMIGKVTSQTLGSFGPYVVLACIYLLAAILTEIISNNAVAALLTPLAFGIAHSIGADPKPFIIAVMFGSSASFSTPIGYQTNTFVYGAGGYRFTDFTRVGLPLAVILWVISSFLIPILWPF